MHSEHRCRRSRWAIASGLLAAACAIGGCAVDTQQPRADERDGTKSDPLYTQRDTLWTSPFIYVCFDADVQDPAYDYWKNIVEVAVQNSWQQASAVTFVGWETCAPGVGGIHVTFRDQNPHAVLLGRQLDGVVGGVVLNLWFQATPSPSPSTPINVLLGWTAVHEFGHALGFQHEQDRPDALSSASPWAWVSDFGGMTETDCVQRYATNRGVPAWYDEAQTGGVVSPIGYYDHISVMNYCNIQGRITNWGVLSPGDVAAVQSLYGAPSR